MKFQPRIFRSLTSESGILSRRRILSLLLCGLTGCQPELDQQQKVLENGPSAFYSNSAGARAQVPHSIPADPIPVVPELNLASLQRGRELYDRSCSVCHGLSGSGDGIAVRHGGLRPEPFVTLENNIQESEIVSDITSGHGHMKSLASQVDVAERWEIAYYVKALVISQSSKRSDLPLRLQKHFAEGP